MEKIVCTIAMCIISVCLYAQQEVSDTTALKQPSSKFEAKQLESGLDKPLTAEERKEIERRISLVDSHLRSIQIKRDYILNDPEQKKIAEETGWFTDMEATESRLKENRASLVYLLENR